MKTEKLREMILANAERLRQMKNFSPGRVTSIRTSFGR